MAAGEDQSCEESEEEVDGNVTVYVEGTHAGDAYSVRDPCSHRERYMRAAQIDLVVNEVSYDRASERTKRPT